MAEAGAGERFKVFISYSRRDSSDFVDELIGGLELAGFAPFLDRHDIAAGEDWEARLGGLIGRADTVVFVVSPEAVKSERCAWEVDQALAKTKRLLPIIFKSVPLADIPARLQRLQFVRFDSGPGITRPLGQLAEALRQDLDWIREHTRLGEAAARWQARGRPESLLLRGDDLAGAQSWANSRNPSAPAITESIRDYMAASKEAEAASFARSNKTQRRIIRMQALVSALLIVVIIGLVGWINQSSIKEEWRWYTVVRPYLLTQIRPHVLTAAAEQALKPGASFQECTTDCPQMIVIPAGSFTMGSPASETGHLSYEEPQHVVTFAKPFAVSKFELTFADWDACVTYGDCERHVTDSGWGRGQQPVINVSWTEAEQYVAWLSQMTGKPYRLLSEAEYEYVARAGTQMAFPWGDDIGVDDANCDHCGSMWDNMQPAPVGSFAPNHFALYDMVGNVWEWVEDCDHDNYDSAPSDGSPWMTGCLNDNRRVDRGGSWSSPPTDLRAAERDKRGPEDRFNDVGLRVARTIGP